MKFLVINGPNLNMLGVREPAVYGTKTYGDLTRYIKSVCRQNGVRCTVFQSNHEGKIVERIQKAYRRADGIIINPAAFTHTSVAILDALKAVALPAVEVHLSDVDSREAFRQTSYVRAACCATFSGMGFEGYAKAVVFLKDTVEGKVPNGENAKAAESVKQANNMRS